MAKKDLDISNPAMNFISTPEPKEAQTGDPQEVAKVYYKFAPKNKRLQLLVKEQLDTAIREEAKRSGQSVNETAHRILEEALLKNLID